jgi:Protein of unknown function (DUF4232)
MTTSLVNLRSRRALAGAALTAACVAVSIPAATAATPATVRPAVPSCATSQLKAGMGSSEGTAGAIYTAINFTNISGTSCSLYGFPGVSLSDGSPYTPIGLSAGWNSDSTKVLVTLAPGATGNAVLKIADAYNFPTSPCDPTSTTYLVVYPPNNSVPIHLKFAAVTCAGPVQTLTADAVQAGASS